MTVGELINKLGELSPETRVNVYDDIGGVPEHDLNEVEYDEDRDVVVLS